MVKAAPSFMGNRIRDPGPTQALALTVGEGLPDGGFLTFSRPQSWRHDTGDEHISR